MRKILYIANIRLPTEKAHGLQIMEMCSAFRALGNDVELVVPWRFNSIKENPFTYYDIKESFKITKVPSLDLVKFGKIGFWLQSVSFTKFAVIYALLKTSDIVYSRDISPLFFLSFFKKNLFWGPPKNIFWEAHRGEFNFMVKRLVKKSHGVIVITQGLKNFYVAKGMEADKILVVPDAVDLEKFDIKISKVEAREKLNLPKSKKIILYTGHFYDWKGADILAEAIRFLNPDVLIVFVGGMEKDVNKFKTWNSEFKNIMVVGYRSHDEIPYWLKAADVLVLPNSAKEKISELYTSPMKMFEYMASARPIVASNLPSIREVLEHERSAFLVQPDSPEFLTEGIKKVLEDSGLAEKISKQAYLDVQKYTWVKRTENILEFIKNKS